ncbi:MAG: hypothetical protein IE925_11270 [Rhodobacterales bacterium]|nr:hypothetical protein [Rhodobacterales bacterium]
MNTDAFGQKKDTFAVVQPKAPEANPQAGTPPAPLQAEHLPDLHTSDSGDHLKDDHARRVGVIRTRFASRLESAGARVNRAQSTWDEIHGEVNRQPRYSGPWFYMPFMILLAIAEVPINRLSFELFFRESPAIALVVSLLVGGVLVVLSHRLGMALGRFEYFSKQHGWVREALQVVVVTLLIGALCYGLSVLRQGFLAAAVAPEFGFADAMNGGGAGAALMSLEPGLNLEGWIFLFINVAVVLVGVSASYFCHDAHPDFQKADVERKRSEKELAKLKAQVADAEAAEQRRYANQLRRRAG